MSEAPKPAEPEGVVGLSLSEIDEALRTEKSLGEDAKGLFVANVDEASDAFGKGIRAGDIITDAGQQSVSTIDEFKEMILRARARKELKSLEDQQQLDGNEMELTQNRFPYDRGQNLSNEEENVERELDSSEIEEEIEIEPVPVNSNNISTDEDIQEEIDTEKSQV